MPSTLQRALTDYVKATRWWLSDNSGQFLADRLEARCEVT
jgi:hypothetical protein